MRGFWVGVGLAGVIGLAVTPAAMARPPYMAAFHEKYGITAESNVGKARCGACHVNPMRASEGWTRYGKDVAVALGKKQATRDEAIAAFTKIENDTIGRQMEKYVDRIKADKLPGGDPPAPAAAP
jgi:hypothetical protein